jgi:hypothetical protein
MTKLEGLILKICRESESTKGVHGNVLTCHKRLRPPYSPTEIRNACDGLVDKKKLSFDGIAYSITP